LLFNTIQEHRIEIGAGRPIELATRLSDSAQTYVALKRGERRTGVEVPSLTHIRSMAPTVTQPLAALLTVADRLQSTSGFTHLCNALEVVTLVYGVTRERWNRFEVALPSITRGLRACNNSADLSAVGELLLEEHVRSRVNEFWRALDDVRNVPERTQRYLLAGIALFIQERSRASQYRAHNSIMELSVEHILPQCALTESDSDGAAWRTAFGNISVDQAGSWVYRLGNLALLPTETNSRIGGKLFPVKAAAYQAEPLLLTQMIATDIRVGRATGRREFAEEFDVQPTDSWNQSHLLERHELLKRLISLTWPLLPGAIDLTTSL
jgi:hypothetical protein